ncbi:MAG: dephospho-CoA kinase [candidate division Zixibacteria bacterium HGW-Zixibacteria-1]|nr:MAG: dephospho-CoA kinase [candidate division Zixibacteria bacterium HGW-Zixibacteria-1]
MLIGITGQIGSGKTEAAKIFAKYGAYVISADKIGRDVVENSPVVLKKLIRAFGQEILTPSGKLRRKYLARLAFADSNHKDKLNRIVHPVLLKELGRQSRAALKKYKIVIIDAALLLDWGWDKMVDLTIVVHSTDRAKISRLVEKGYTMEEAKMRLRSQLKLAEFRARADIIIQNNKSLSSLELRIKKILQNVIPKRVDC